MIRIIHYKHLVSHFGLKSVDSIARCTSNPVVATDRTETGQADPDIRFLGLSELDALLRAAAARMSAPAEDGEPPDARAPIDHALYLAAAMRGHPRRQADRAALA